MKKLTIDVAALVLRIAIGLIFIPHGYSKVFGAHGAAGFAADMPSYGIPAFLGYAAAYAEFFGAILLIAGFLTRVDAFLLACTMGVAVFVVQMPDALNGLAPGGSKFPEVMKAIELPLSLMSGSVALLLLGAGRLSVDGLLRLDERLSARLWKKKTAAEAAVLPISQS